jgi:uncharacterized protein YggE
MKSIQRAGVLGMLAAAAWAQTAGSHLPLVRATGEATVLVQPDEAKIDIGVTVHSPTADAAASQNAAQLQSVIDQLRVALGPKADIRTMNYSLNPSYVYPKTGGKATIDGYDAVNTVEVTTGDLPGLGKLIDAVTKAGANLIPRLQFTLKDESQARAEALQKAVNAARTNANAMADAAGLRLGKITLLEQGAPQVIRPMMMMAEAQTASAPTPIQSGAIEVHASVTLEAELQK